MRTERHAAFRASLSTHRRASRPARFGFVALTRSACQRHMVGQREGRNGRDAILCVRNRSQIGRNKMRPSRDWRKCHQCALLMGRRKRGRETCRGRLGGTPRPTMCHMCALPVCGSSVGASGNACAVSDSMCRQRTSETALLPCGQSESAAEVRQTPRCGGAGRREVSRPSHEPRIRGWMAHLGSKADSRWRNGGAAERADRRRANRGG